MFVLLRAPPPYIPSLPEYHDVQRFIYSVFTQDTLDRSLAEYSLCYRSLLQKRPTENNSDSSIPCLRKTRQIGLWQNIVSVTGLFCKRDVQKTIAIHLFRVYERHVRQVFGRIQSLLQVSFAKETYKKQQRFIYSVFTKDTLDEKGQARDSRAHVTL